MPDEQNQNIKDVQGEFEKCQQERDEYLNNWKRERADFLNYKKDETKRLEDFVKFANEAVILEVIEVLDDLERAAKEVKNEGLGQVLNKFQELLNKYGIERIKTEGKFDPLLHEAVTTETLSEEEKTEKEEEKLEEIRAGYMIHGKVIRSARVKIIK